MNGYQEVNYAFINYPYQLPFLSSSAAPAITQDFIEEVRDDQKGFHRYSVKTSNLAILNRLIKEGGDTQLILKKFTEELAVPESLAARITTHLNKSLKIKDLCLEFKYCPANYIEEYRDIGFLEPTGGFLFDTHRLLGSSLRKSPDSQSLYFELVGKHANADKLLRQQYRWDYSPRTLSELLTRSTENSLDILMLVYPRLTPGADSLALLDLLLNLLKEEDDQLQHKELYFQKLSQLLITGMDQEALTVFGTMAKETPGIIQQLSSARFVSTENSSDKQIETLLALYASASRNDIVRHLKGVQDPDGG